MIQKTVHKKGKIMIYTYVNIKVCMHVCVCVCVISVLIPISLSGRKYRTMLIAVIFEQWVLFSISLVPF